MAPDRIWVLLRDPGASRAWLLASGSPAGARGRVGERWNLKAPVDRREGEPSRVPLTHRRGARS